jgi:hypothetical protein
MFLGTSDAENLVLKGDYYRRSDFSSDKVNTVDPLINGPLMYGFRK